MDIPLIVTEQYPEKLGRTINELDIQHAVGVFPKIQFSMITPEVESKLNYDVMGNNLNHVVLFGIAVSKILFFFVCTKGSHPSHK